MLWVLRLNTKKSLDWAQRGPLCQWSRAGAAPHLSPPQGVSAKDGPELVSPGAGVGVADCLTEIQHKDNE